MAIGRNLSRLLLRIEADTSLLPQGLQRAQTMTAQFSSKASAAFGIARKAALAGAAATAALAVGTGRAVSEICRMAVQRLRPLGTLVANITSINHVAATHDVLRAADLQPCVRMISVAMSTEQMESVRFEAFNPTFLLTAKKEA